MQRSFPVARQVAGLPARLQGRTAVYSTLVDPGRIPPQYALPLTLLPISRAENTIGSQPLPLYAPSNTTCLPASLQRDNPFALAVPPAWHMSYLPPQEALLPLLRLQTTLNTQDVEPPKPEKPKWEE
jgi:hypothetical protein